MPGSFYTPRNRLLKKDRSANDIFLAIFNKSLVILQFGRTTDARQIARHLNNEAACEDECKETPFCKAAPLRKKYEVHDL